MDPSPPQPPPLIEADSSSGSNLGSMIMAIFIGGLLLAIFFWYYSERQPTLMQEDREEARRKRLEKLEQQQQTQKAGDVAEPAPAAAEPEPPAIKKEKATIPANKKEKATVCKTVTPLESLLHALSSITGKTTTTAILPANVSWEEIQSCAASGILFQPFQTQITHGSKSQSEKTPSYAPTKLTDRPLYKASHWYHHSKTWVRDHATVLQETAKQPLQQVLELFQTWIVQTLVQQLHANVSTLLQQQLLLNNNNDQDDDSDLGLFADHSYGGTLQSVDDTKNTTSMDEDDSLFSELLFLLSDSSGPKVLTKPFLAHLQHSYDHRATTPSPSLATTLLHQCMGRLPPPEHRAPLEWDSTQRNILALTNLFTLSPESVRTLADAIVLDLEGKQLEERSTLRPLLCLAACTVPRFRPHAAAAAAVQNPTDRLLPPAYHAAMVQAMATPEFYPVALHAVVRRPEYDQVVATFRGTNRHVQAIMKAARAAGALALRRLAANNTDPTTRKGGLLLDWIKRILETNEPLVDMLQSDLLSPDSAQALCASRPFLLGLASSLLQMCNANLSTRMTDLGWEAFDYRYFWKEGASLKEKPIHCFVIPAHERCLIDDNKTDHSSNNRPERFPGATEFFFLTAALLRVSLFPGFRVLEEFQSMLRGLFSSIQQLADQQPSVDRMRQVRPDIVEQMQKCTSVAQGWNTFVDDPDINPLITAFCLLQLQWVSHALPADSRAAASIPEWFVKLPSQWLAHVAAYTPHLLQSHQGEAAVQYATRILQAGTATTSSQITQRSFSPPVLCQLIRIAGAFVREGVRRARNRERAKSHRHARRRGFSKQSAPSDDTDDEDFELDIIDDRTLDIYHSFDKNDLGVTVFTNNFVARHLCPTLMRAYMAMDAVEGMDVEREHRFEKFEVKHEVADLLLRLWCHPNGQSRSAIVGDLDEVAMNEFCSSIAGALGFQLDQSCQFILDIRDIKVAHESSVAVVFASNRGHEPPPLSQVDAAAIEHHAKFISFSLYQCRRLLLILCSFSRDEKIAASLGGGVSSSPKKSVGKSAAADLAAMFLNLMERLTDEDGGIHPELEMRQVEPEERSSVVLSDIGSIAPDRLKAQLHYLLHSRRFALLEYGMDVSLLTHQFLALAARWHLAAVSSEKLGKRTSKFLEALVAKESCDPKRIQNVFRRLVGAPKEMSGTEEDNAEYILERDGHVDLTIWKDFYKFEGSGPDKGKSRKRTAKQDRMCHSDLESIADIKDIEAFLNDLAEAAARKDSIVVAARWGTSEMQALEETVFTVGDHLEDEAYTEALKDWVVSSDSFLSAAGNGCFAHSYDSIVRARGVEVMGAGKILVKEARKCVKLIPQPHPNTSVFVCFAEERTDLCKAIIIGAADTPFSLGMFEFDILFPVNYPQSPPLFNFKTTGDGRTRISSNLYNDGKVCISILGTYQAFDDSQRWNPSTSSLAQVLASLQTQLLGDAEPYFSEGFNHDSVRGTPAGEQGSKRFNNKIRLHTLRYAIIAPLKHPPLGFDAVTKRHFALCRKRVLAQARLWTTEAQLTPLYKSFVRAYEEIATLLSADDLVWHKAPGQSDARAWGGVPLHEADFRNLEQIDHGFVQLHHEALHACLATDRGAPPASPDPESVTVALEHAASLTNANQLSIEYNPWATGVTSTWEAPARPVDSPSGDDEDDGFDQLYD